MNIYQVKNIVIGRIMKNPNNPTIFQRTITFKGDVKFALTLHSHDKERLELEL